MNATPRRLLTISATLLCLAGSAAAEEPTITLSQGVLLIDGTSGRDTCYVSESRGLIDVTIYSSMPSTGVTETAFASFSTSLVGSILFYGYAGDDLLYAPTDHPTIAYGGSGDDTMTTGSADDVLVGGLGFDNLYANGGNDTLEPGAVVEHEGDVIGGPGIDTFVVAYTYHFLNGQALLRIPVYANDDFVGGTDIVVWNYTLPFP